MKLDYEKISRIVLFTLRLQEGTPSTPVSRIKVKIYFKIMNLLKGEQMKPQTEGKKEPIILYRYEISYKSYDDETDVVLKEYPVLRETDFCYFINPQIIGIPKEAKKRVLKLEKFNNGYHQTGEHTKRFAYINKNDAKLNFIKRTQRRIAWYDFWKEECKKGLEIIKTKNET